MATNSNAISNIFDRFQNTFSKYPNITLRVIRFVENSSRSLSSFFKNIEEMAEEKRREFPAQSSERAPASSQESQRSGARNGRKGSPGASTTAEAH